MGFSRQEYWNGLPFAPPEDLPDPGIKLPRPVLKVDSLLAPGEVALYSMKNSNLFPINATLKILNMLVQTIFLQTESHHLRDYSSTSSNASFGTNPVLDAIRITCRF